LHPGVRRRWIVMAEETKELAQEVRRITPPVDIYETDNDVILVADIPGVGKKNLTLDIDDDELTISGTFEEIKSDGEKLIDECVYGEYRRTFTLGDIIDREKIAAKLEDGVLTLTLPKHEKTKPRKIEISTG
jgi:HSP20 family protein